MTTAVAKREPAEIIEQVIAKGNLAELTPTQRTDYYRAVCESIGLNSLTKPFEYITLNGKLTLYARKDATDQLRKIHGVSVQIVSREKIDDVYAVTARATDARGRTDESIGAVTISSLKGDALCNALMKAETKAKRRVTLSICGLGMLDEAELETIPQARIAEHELREEVAEVIQDALNVAAVRSVKLEGAQPKPSTASSAGTRQILGLIAGLKWGAEQVRGWMETEFNYLVETDNFGGFFDSLQNAEQRKIIAALKAAFGGTK